MYKLIEREEIKKRVLKEIAEGKSLNQITNKEGIPDDNTIYTWLNKDAQFKDNYVRARADQAVFYAEKIENTIKQLKESGDITRETIAVTRLEIDAYKWTASKLLPKVYGTNQQQTNVQVNIAPITGMDIK